MSSSAIGYITLILGPTGPEGPIGNVGPIGPDGITSGIRGSTGPFAPYITNVFLNPSGATVEFSDNSKLSVLGSFRGNTLTDTSKVTIVDYIDPNTDSITYSLLSSGNLTSNFIMRGISASGSLIVTEDSQAIYIDSIYNPQDGQAQGQFLTDNTLIYLKDPTTASSTTIGTTYNPYYTGTFNFERDSANLQFSKLLPKSKLKYIHPTYKTASSTPIKLNVTDAGVFYIRTPNGISEFTGDFRANEIVSFTLITQSDDIWHFPTNVYFENGENYLTCGKSIINLTSFDQGSSWYAVVAARGFDGSTFNCEINSLVGSCCYKDADGNQKCNDFSNRIECNSLAGTFYPLRSCKATCSGEVGVCCSNGFCIDTNSISECLAFGGRYIPGIACSDYPQTGDNGSKLCFDPCGQKVACCKDGICLGDNITKVECEQILGGVAHVGSECDQIDCCENNVRTGACCQANAVCVQRTLNDCRLNGGVFMGEGVGCTEINCQCVTPPVVIFGSCCSCSTQTPGTTACSIVASTQCTNGTFTAIPGAVLGDACPPSSITSCNNTNPSILNCPVGRCCKCNTPTTVTCTDTTQAQCAAASGTFTSGTNCTASPCSLCGTVGCQCPVPGIKCRCNQGVRQCATTNNIQSDPDCQSGSVWTCSSAATSCANSPCNSVLPLCTPVPGYKCECVTGIPTCTAVANILSEQYCIDNPTKCSQSSNGCLGNQCSSILLTCVQNDVKCRCVNNVRTCTQTDISTDPACSNGTATCVQNANCGTNPCDTALPQCGSSCPPQTPEHVQCEGMSLVEILPCDQCTSGYDVSGNTFAASKLPSKGYNFQAGSIIPDSLCPLIGPNPTNSFKINISGAQPVDLYIPLETMAFDGPDARFCIDIRITPRQRINGGEPTQKRSVRAYLLRTFYPKYFSTNYAAMRGYTYADGSGVVQYINPASAGPETSPWPHLSYISSLTTSAGQQNTSTMVHARNLSSFLTEELVDHIPVGDTTINLNTTRLIEELNCPLLGYNPRGIEIAHENNSGALGSAAPSTGNLSPATSANTYSNGYVYPLGASYDAPGYYSTVNILGIYNRFDSSLGTHNPRRGPFSEKYSIDSIGYTASDGSTKFSKTGFLSRTRQLVPGALTIERVRTVGYSDFGLCTICESFPTNIRYSEPVVSGDVNSAIPSIGYYVQNATLNRFANVFSNNRLIQYDSMSQPTPLSELLAPSGVNWIGHPLTIDFESNYTIQPISPAPGQNIDVLKIKYDAANETPGGLANLGNGYTNSYVNGLVTINKSPIYKTRPEAIICDTGPMDQDGYHYPDFNDQTAHNVKYSKYKRKVYGAINNPWYDSPAGLQVEPDGASRAESIISYSEDGMKICVRMKNFKDYILQQQEISSRVAQGVNVDEYNYLMTAPTANSRNTRFRRNVNSLRLIIFPDPVNNFADNLEFPNFENQFTSYVNSASNYLQNVLDPNDPTTNDKFKIKFSCLENGCNSAAQAGQCDACSITPSDKTTNMYGFYGMGEFMCALSKLGPPACPRCAPLGCVRTTLGGSSQCGAGNGPCIGAVCVPCRCGPQTIECEIPAQSIAYSVFSNCRNCTQNPACTGREVNNFTDIPAASQTIQCPPGDPCPTCPGPGDGDGGKPPSCHYETMASSDFIKFKEQIKKYFDEFGFVEGDGTSCPPGTPDCADYWFLETQLGSSVPIVPVQGGNIQSPMVLFKLLPSMKKLQIDGDIDYYQTPQEVYSLDRVAPVWWQTGSIVPHAFYRKAICEGSAGLPVELRYFANSPLKAVVPAGIGNATYPQTYQPKFCAFLNEVPTQVIRQNLNGFTTINQKMYDWLSDTDLHLHIGLVNEGTETFDFPSPHANHIYAQHGAACPNAVTPFTNGTNYKKLFISEDQFICVAMDCSNIDCSNYQDCVP